ncbi:MAG TPA: hypothetical protein VMD30_06310 [Tepidisphaeraceae bacterium]|nr:hypothetical protein [Tepidisphaeraceae bacterium]
MRPPLKLNSIDQEHLQELYDSSGVARDELPYSQAFDDLCQGFQDRTFKNAHPEQIFAAMIKYVRSSGNAAKEMPKVTLTDEQLKQIKILLPRHSRGGKILPYGDEFEAALKEFNKAAGLELTPGEFWRAIVKMAGPKRRPPTRTKVAVATAEEDEEGE